MGLKKVSVNNAATRLAALESAEVAIVAAITSDEAGAAQEAVKRALEAIHELQDCANRNEWSRAGWSADESGLWRAHLGARNAAHHMTLAGLVALDVRGQPAAPLTWEPGAADNIDSKGQRREYDGRLAGQPVLPGVRQLLALVKASGV